MPERVLLDPAAHGVDGVPAELDRGEGVEDDGGGGHGAAQRPLVAAEPIKGGGGGETVISRETVTSR